MPRACRWLGCALLLLSTCPAQAFDLGGELEAGIQVFGVADTLFSVQTGRARVQGRQDLGPNARVELGIEALSYSGQSAIRVLDLLPPAYGEGLDSLQTLIWDQSLLAVFGHDERPTAAGALGRWPSFDSIALDRALISWSAGAIAVDLGRQPLAWGAGYAWNPSNIFNRKVLLEPTRDVRGLDLLRLRLGSTRRMELVLLPDDRPEDCAAAVRLGGGLGGWDLNLVASRLRWRRMDWEFWADPDRAPPVLEWDSRDPYWLIYSEKVERLSLGGDLRGELRGLGCWVEGAWNHLDPGLAFWDLTLGLDRLFETQTYLLLEYHREGEGQIDPADYRLNDWLKTLTGERGGMGRHYAFGLLNHPVADLSELSLLSVWNLSDGSGLTQALLERSLADDLVLQCALDLVVADEGDELGQIGHGAFVRLKAFF